MAPTMRYLVASLLLPALAAAQQIGTTVAEKHPALITKQCKAGGGCQTLSTSVVIDSGSRSLHKVGDTSTACTLGSAPLCADASSCASNCALEGLNYTAKGVTTSADTLTLNQFVKGSDGSLKVVTPRIYLLAPDGQNYLGLQLLNQEISFDVDVSKLACGMNGALYLSEMNATGGRGSLNPAGAAYGTGYCDAQCPKLNFIDGVVRSFPFSYVISRCLMLSQRLGLLFRQSQLPDYLSCAERGL